MTIKKIIIVGAGIAGLAASARLIEYGFDVLILEARDHYGGRISTKNVFGMPFGLGASWIHGDKGNPMTTLAKKTHTKMVKVDPNKFVVFDHKGEPFPYEDKQKFDKKFELLLHQAKKIAFDSENDISLFCALSKIIEQHPFSPIEYELYKTKLLFFESYIGANDTALSARYWDQEEAWPGENCFLTSTYLPIIDDLAAHCNIKLNTIVTKINMNANNIEVITKDKAVYADIVIITVPLGVLKKNDIVFNPPLPHQKQKAIERLGMGLFNITAIEFPKAFWSNESHAMFFTQFDASSISVFFNLHHFINQPILVGYSGGNRAQRLENLTDEQLIEKTMQNFREMFGHSLPNPKSYVNSRWSHDPFSYGSYSYVPTGASGDDYDEIAKTVSNRLFFAGEATSLKHPATTHGAYLSGIREAEKIQAWYG